MIEDILIANLDFLAIKLSSYSNEELLSNFKKDFLIINDYVPVTALDKTQILEYSKAYIEEFKVRVGKDSATQIVEFAKLLQDLMKHDKTFADSFYTRTLVRLYSYAVKVMKDKGIPDMFLKKDFL